MKLRLLTSTNLPIQLTLVLSILPEMNQFILQNLRFWNLKLLVENFRNLKISHCLIGSILYLIIKNKLLNLYKKLHFYSTENIFPVSFILLKFNGIYNKPLKTLCRSQDALIVELLITTIKQL